MKVKEGFKTTIGTLFRLFPLSTEPGLRAFGNPSEDSPVFVTSNFHLTVKRVSRYLKDLDCYLLVAPTSSINVWCAAVGGMFNAHSIISVIKTSGIGERVNHRTLILPQLSAPGVDTELIKEETGWHSRFGPVYAKEIPEYVRKGFQKSDDMRRVKFNLMDRLDTGIGVSLPFFLPVAVILAIFWRGWLLGFVALGGSLLLLMYASFPYIPGRSGWAKVLFYEALVAAGLLIYLFPVGGDSSYIRNLFLAAMILVPLIGIDFGGVSPLYKSDLDPLLHRIGIHRIGSVSFKGRATIKEEKITLDQSECIGCELCYDVCPKGIYDMDESQNVAIMVKPDSECVACRACVLQCPTDAISLRARR